MPLLLSLFAKLILQLQDDCNQKKGKAKELNDLVASYTSNCQNMETAQKLSENKSEEETGRPSSDVQTVNTDSACTRTQDLEVKESQTVIISLQENIPLSMDVSISLDASTQTYDDSTCPVSIGIQAIPETISVGTQVYPDELASRFKVLEAESHSEGPDDSELTTTIEETDEEYQVYSEVDTEYEDIDGQDPQSEEFSRLRRETTRDLMKKEPKLYLGINSECYFIVDMLSERLAKLMGTGTKVTKEDAILIVLRKLKLNEPFACLANDFGISRQQASRIFSFLLPSMASLLKDLIFWPKTVAIEEQLPLQFRHAFKKVKSIIDCFEIEIEQPSNPLHQALTWSEYKHTNTVKYLIAITPDGLVSFVSKGFSGRISDTQITTESGFLSSVPRPSEVMADRGFKNIEADLAKIGCSLTRPCSATAGTAMSSSDVVLSRKIAAARIHVERAISRLREYSMLKPHSCIPKNMLDLLDDAVICVCGLVNLQKPLI